MKKYVITYDIGTTGIKTCLIEIEDSMRILASATAGYNLYVDDETGVKGGAEQDVDEWWSAMCSTTRTVFDKMPAIKKEQVEGISFCSAMQGLVLVDKDGNCIRRPIWTSVQEKNLKKVWLTVSKLQVLKLQSFSNISNIQVRFHHL